MTLKHHQLIKIIIRRGLGYSQQEIADELGVSIKTIQKHLRELKIGAQEAIRNGKFDEYYYGILIQESSLLRILLSKHS